MPPNRAWSITLGKIKRGARIHAEFSPNLVARCWEELYFCAIESAMKFGNLPNNHREEM